MKVEIKTKVSVNALILSIWALQSYRHGSA